MVSVSALLVPPLVQPRSPELPLGVLTVTLAVPEPEITSVVIVTCNSLLLWTVVVNVLPLMITTEDETKSEPFTVRRNPACTWANVTVLGESEPMTGVGRELPHNGFRALQPGKNSKASTTASRVHRMESPRLLHGESALPLEKPVANDAWYINRNRLQPCDCSELCWLWTDSTLSGGMRLVLGINYVTDVTCVSDSSKMRLASPKS